MATKKKVSTVAVVATTSSSSTALSLEHTTQSDVPAIIEQLKSKLAALNGGEEESVSLDIVYSNGKNIKSITSVKELLEISSSIRARSDAYDKEVERYSLTGRVEKFLISEKSVAHWEKVIGKAIVSLINAKEVEQIKQSIKDLSEYLDNDTKIQNKIKSIIEHSMAPIK